MRFVNLMSVGAVLALAACDDSGTKETGTTDTDTQTDTETNETTETGSTGGGGGSGPWTSGYVGYTVLFGVDGSGNLTSVKDIDGNEIPPLLIVNVVSTGYFEGDDDEICEIDIDLTGASSTTNATNGNYAAWTTDTSAMTVVYDDCTGAMTMSDGTEAVDVFGARPYIFQVGPFNTDFWYDFMYSTTTQDYAANGIGGAFTDLIFAAETGTGYLEAPTLGRAWPTDDTGTYDYNVAFTAAEVPSGAGVQPGFYYMQTVFYGPL